ncbi:MAG TPA: nicotinate (nicotinamide) nucleotide adenylyltransferase [Ginsengibacter sp.]|nr:nicotinate (nicotinamide) nucleotide adenylyltransferase [Ginsengibacter sp.]HRP16483.1 nicotinate (nicotinamide) nucleotide adenylyltransferase [Ginsengibacter sp.]HRP43883.1 nicotinate (nicotinamide) nucleotide adenylyltransferase [Ginsengibacter sp.]
MRIGLYFGSFNPIHHGHLIIASHMVNFTDLQRVWFVVSPQNPFKQSASLLNERHRKHLVDLAVEDDINLKTCDIEFKLPRPSYTIDTLIHLEERYPQHEFTVIMGSDSFQNIKKWKNGNLLIKNYPIKIYLRSGFPVDPAMLKHRIEVVEAPILQISGTLIRKLIKERKSIRYLVPEKVREEIENQQFYF